MTLFEAIGGTKGCESLSAGFYARVARDPVLRPLFPGKSLRCAIEAFSSFLVQFLGGPAEDTQHRWHVSLRESHAQFRIGPREREAWLANMQAMLAGLENADAREALTNLFAHSSAYIARAKDRVPLKDEIGARWENQLHLEQAMAAVHARDGATASVHAESVRAHNRAAFFGALVLMIGVAPAYVRKTIQADPTLIHDRHFGRTLLHYAAAAGDVSVVELLLELGADANLPDSGGHPPLYRLADGCQTAAGPAIVRALIGAGARVNMQSGIKRTSALHMAARRGNIEIGRTLLECGADPNARDSEGVTPLQRAQNCRKHEFVAAMTR